MTNRRRTQRRRPSGRRGNNGSIRGSISPVAFHTLLDATLSGVTGNAALSCSPNGGSFLGLNEIADQFDLFRFQRLRYRIHPMDPTDTVNQGAAFYPDVDIQTQTIAQLAQSPLAAVQTPFCGVPSRWVSVPRSQLKGMLDWYKCNPDAGAAEFESQGLIQLAGGLSDVLKLEMEGVVLFKNPVSSALMIEHAINRAVAAGLVIRIPSTSKGPVPEKNGTATPTLR